MKYVTLYRVESKEGIGPYQEDSDLWIDTEKLSSRKYLNRCPPPPYESHKFFCRKHYFGFPSIEELKKWFNRYERNKLKKANFVISVYSCPITKFTFQNDTFDSVINQFGENQTVFIKEIATKIKEISFDEIEIT